MIKKNLAILMAIVMIITMLPMTTAAAAAGFSDMPSNWATAALESAVASGLINGDNGKIMPDKNLTRAQMAAIVNRAFGTTKMASISGYSDVAAGSWYYNDMAKAVQMGTFVGDGGKLNPDSYITRQEAFLVISRAIKLSDGNASALDNFQDKGSISSWAKSAVSAMTASGYVNGADGKVNPLANITRAEIAQIMYNLIKGYISTEGTYTSVVSGNLMINVPDVTLKGVTVTGDLIIGDGVGDGNVTLDNVTVTGRTVIRGGGVNSIEITGTSNLQNIVIARVDGQVRVYAADGTAVGNIIVDGKNDVIIQGNVGTVTLLAPNVMVTATNAKIITATIEGENSQIVVASGSTINRMTVTGSNAAVNVSGVVTSITVNGQGAVISGSGKVESVAANANNVAVKTQNTNVIAAMGTTGIIAGTTSVPEGATVNTSPVNTGGNFISPIPPTVTLVSPTSGPDAGGTSVIITGANFTGATAVSFGGTPATSFTVNSSSTQITATAPAHASGTINVVVEGTATNTGAYTYLPAPSITTISPTSGPTAGGTIVTITGINLTGATAVSFSGTPAISFTVDSSTQITAKVPAHVSATVDVIVETPEETVIKKGAYTYLTAPTINTVYPWGKVAGGDSVIITGANFTGATAVSFGYTPATSLIVVSSTIIIAIAPAHAFGPVNVEVKTPGGTGTSTGTYTYCAPPTITSVSPDSQPAGGGTEVTITGTNFEVISGVKFGNTPALTFTRNSSTEISAIAPPPLPNVYGPVNVTVETAGGTSNAGTFVYSQVINFAASPITMSTVAGGLTGNLCVVGSHGSQDIPPNFTSNINLSGNLALVLAQVVKGDFTTAEISATFTTSTNLSLVGSTIPIYADLYVDTNGDNIYEPLASYPLNPALTGLLDIGTNSSLPSTSLPSTPLLSIPNGSKILMLCRIEANGLSLINTLKGSITAQVTLH